VIGEISCFYEVELRAPSETDELMVSLYWSQEYLPWVQQKKTVVT